MRNMKKIRLAAVVVSVVLLVGASVSGTLAWMLGYTTPVTNTFSTSDIRITIDESDDLDLKMVPGCEIFKDPVVTVEKDSEPCWLFVLIEESKNYDEYLEKYIINNEDNEWKEIKDNALLPTMKLYARKVVDDTDATKPLSTDKSFYILKDNKVTVKDTVTKEQMNKISGVDGAKPSLTFTAYAIQCEGIDTAEKAWKALDPYVEFPIAPIIPEVPENTGTQE